MRILFKFPEKSEREGEAGCDANLQFQNIPASLRAQKGALGEGGGGRPGKGGDGGDLNPLAYSHPDAIVILIRLFVISLPLIRPNSPRFHNASLLLSLFSGRLLSVRLSFSLLVAVSLKRCQIDGRVLRRLKYMQLPLVRERKNYFVPHQTKEFSSYFLLAPENVHFSDLAN